MTMHDLSKIGRVVAVVTMLCALAAVGIQSVGLMRLNGILHAVDWNRRRLGVIEDTLRSRTIRFVVIDQSVEIVGAKIDTLAMRVDRIEKARITRGN
jgi:hypothetical protein